jgi:hypothetical protein
VVGGFYETLMIEFDNISDADLASYEYQVYAESQVTGTNPNFLLVASPTVYKQGFVSGNSFTVSVENSDDSIDKKYYVRVRSIDTSNNISNWTNLVASNNTPLIEAQYIGSLNADKITTGSIGAETITLGSAESAIKSSNYVSNEIGWIIKGDGFAEFSSAAIRGGLKAGSVYIDDNNRWLRDSTDTETVPEFKVGTSTNYLYYDGSTLTFSGSLSAATGTFSGSLSAATGTFSGSLSAATGTFSGSVSASTISGSTITGGSLSASTISGSTITGGSVSASTISGSTITGGSININNGTFLINSDGGMTATNADITGTIRAEAGLIGGWTIHAGHILGGGQSNGVMTTLDPNGNNQFGNNVDVGGRVTAHGNSEGIGILALNGGIRANDSSVIGGQGIAYIGPNYAGKNYIAFQWTAPTLYGIIDNVQPVPVGTVSDIRFKKNIADAEDVYVQKLLNNLRIVEFNPHDPETDKTNMDLKNIGVVAQEAIEAFPDLVKDFNKDGSNQYALAVDYLGFVPYLIKTVQYLSNQINNLTTRLTLLESN